MAEDPTLPPSSTPAKAPRRKVIDLARAVASMATAPVLDIVRRRMYSDWLRGVRPRSLRVVYGAPKPLRIDEIDDILRTEARRDKWAA